MASGSVAELMTNEEYKRKVEHSVDPIVVTFLSPLDDKCKAVASNIRELSDEFTTVKSTLGITGIILQSGHMWCRSLVIGQHRSHSHVSCRPVGSDAGGVVHSLKTLMVGEF
ncbi:hypothetical protein N7499_003441 [Penicillium canescens]|uniref:Uncharacterized protein n=1 Tax=Penicillium canescens TaxID=5083 RepID=A0AAD6I9T1_PENCN|nr:uncharacterized protein N7446_012367 [Penicillium canescens]KAJ6020148.1 hypothetical protein N7522_000223 [Penicillium canescens]KAJ6038094.1 hypothetical protein N7460_007865 [Penicillium canescens]KAJ6045503.1 hypothetical protein N7446_012367 [Penicillium canescens]KAJ6061185.1 hypothetical protein N7444_001881 [Penicillium canescens]KAJ6090727.1 hypothetical protein N7499_003441 [Penicillium canescens]